ncbi:MAG: hypothetical protein ACJAS1_005842 [Oleiphilaceae bacterium]|jgi:hypothetical protein
MNESINTSCEVVILSITALATRFAEKHNLNPSVIESLSTGVIERINIFGTSNFKLLTKPQQVALIEVSVKDYFECASMFHDRYINEIEFRAKVQSTVLNLLTSDKE